MKIKGSQTHLALTAVWVVLIVPSVTLWRDSILWVSFMSLYAIVVTHLTGFSAARADENTDA